MKSTFDPTTQYFVDNYMRQAFQMLERQQEDLINAGIKSVDNVWKAQDEDLQEKPQRSYFRHPCKLTRIIELIWKAAKQGNHNKKRPPEQGEIIDMWSVDSIHWRPVDDL